MQSDPYIVLPCFSLEPNKVASFNRVFRKTKMQKDYEIAQRLKNDDTGEYAEFLESERIANLYYQSKKTVKREFHNFTLSQNAHRTLKRKINWLFYLAKSKQVKTYNGKAIFNFKVAFITLTLPAQQKQCTAEITNNLFNQFLTEVRQRTNMHNYVWRLEFQKNGNVHYHMVTDTYLDYFFLLPIWNRILSKAGYIAEYTAKHQNLSLMQYNSAYNSKGTTPFETIAKRYAKGCQNKWEQPNTIDIKSVISKKSISNYISKYFSKNAEGGSICNNLDTLENSKALRLWFCSRSLSKLESITDYCEAVKYDIFTMVKDIPKVREYISQYARVFYFEVFNVLGEVRIFIEKLLKNYANEKSYQPSS